MKPNHPVLTPPWIPLGLSTLVLLGLVVVLKQPAPTITSIRPLANRQPSVVTVTSIQFITKIQWQRHRPPTASTSSPPESSGKWPITNATVDTAPVASGTVGRDLWTQDLVPVINGATYSVNMTPWGRLSLECQGGSTEVGQQFFVPLNSESCVLQIMGVPETPWSVSRTT